MIRKLERLCLQFVDSGVLTVCNHYCAKLARNPMFSYWDLYFLKSGDWADVGLNWNQLRVIELWNYSIALFSLFVTRPYPVFFFYVPKRENPCIPTYWQHFYEVCFCFSFCGKNTTSNLRFSEAPVVAFFSESWHSSKYFYPCKKRRLRQGKRRIWEAASNLSESICRKTLPISMI